MDSSCTNAIECDVNGDGNPSDIWSNLLDSLGQATPFGLQERVKEYEARLVNAARKGQIQAFEQLIRPLQKTIFQMGLHITGKFEDAEEVLQESLLKGWKNLQGFRGDCSFSTWMARIAINQARMKLRKRRSDRFLPIEDGVGDQGRVQTQSLHDQRPNPEQLLLKDEFRFLLMIAVQTLNPPLRRVFLLRYVQGFSIRETGMALNLSNTGVKSRAHRARHRMRYELTKSLRSEQMLPGTTGDNRSNSMTSRKW